MKKMPFQQNQCIYVIFASQHNYYANYKLSFLKINKSVFNHTKILSISLYYYVSLPYRISLAEKCLKAKKDKSELDPHPEFLWETVPWAVELVTIRIAESFFLSCFSSWQWKATRKKKSAKAMLVHPYQKLKAQNPNKAQNEEIILCHQK